VPDRVKAARNGGGDKTRDEIAERIVAVHRIGSVEQATIMTVLNPKRPFVLMTIPSCRSTAVSRPSCAYIRFASGAPRPSSACAATTYASDSVAGALVRKSCGAGRASVVLGELRSRNSCTKAASSPKPMRVPSMHPLQLHRRAGHVACTRSRSSAGRLACIVQRHPPRRYYERQWFSAYLES
jgi:hypothetical protein